MPIVPFTQPRPGPEALLIATHARVFAELAREAPEVAAAIHRMTLLAIEASTPRDMLAMLLPKG